MKTLEDLLQRLQASHLSVTEKALVASLAGDLAGLITQQAAGEDITAELAHIKAQAANLSSAVTSQLAAEFRLWATELVSSLVAKALT